MRLSNQTSEELKNPHKEKNSETVSAREVEKDAHGLAICFGFHKDITEKEEEKIWFEVIEILLNQKEM